MLCMPSALYCRKGRRKKKTQVFSMSLKQIEKGYIFKAEGRREFNLHPLGISKEVDCGRSYEKTGIWGKWGFIYPLPRSRSTMLEGMLKK